MTPISYVFSRERATPLTTDIMLFAHRDSTASRGFRSHSSLSSHISAQNEGERGAAPSLQYRCDRLSRWSLPSGEGLSRLVSNFILYPRQGFAALLIDPTTKIVHTSEQQIVQGVVQAGTTVNMAYFFGTPHEIYSEYRGARIEAGYPWMRPKEEMFGVGWEAFAGLAHQLCVS